MWHSLAFLVSLLLFGCAEQPGQHDPHAAAMAMTKVHEVAPPIAGDGWESASVAVQIEPGVWLTRLHIRGDIDDLRLDPLCCDGPETISVAPSTDHRRLALVTTAVSDVLTTIPIAAARPTEGSQVTLCIPAPGTGVLGAKMSLGVVSDWPGLGPCAELNVPFVNFQSGAPVLDANESLCGFVIGSAGAERSLVLLVQNGDVELLRSIPATPVDDAWVLEALPREIRAEAARVAEDDRDHAVAARLRRLVRDSDPEDFRQMWRLAVNLDLSGEREEAQQVAEQVTVIAPRFSEAWHSLGLIRYRRGDLTGASEAMRIATEVEPKYLAAASTHGVILSQLGQTDEATRILSRCADEAPEQKMYLGNLLIVLTEAGRADEALQRCRDFTAKHPDILHGWEQLASRLDEDDEANTPEVIKARTQIKRLAPRDLNSRLMLAVLYGRSGDAESARREVNGVLELDPKNRMAKRILELLDAEAGGGK